ncbi:MAG: hypothetical protein AAGD25_35285 [Cyanobacteria bacterium P01_F01_bin.150]
MSVVITALAEAEQRFRLRRMEAEEFFLERYDNLPELSDDEKTALTELRCRCTY